MISVSALDENRLAFSWEQLEKAGYLVVNDLELGLPTTVREHLRREYFTNRVLRCYPEDIPRDRRRARDVVQYLWDQKNLILRENDEIAIQNRGEGSKRREYQRTPVLNDPLFKNWIAAALSLIPPSRRHRQGTFAINMFRTFTDVVTKPHRDDEQFILIYVVDKRGDGAETTLYESENSEVPSFRRTLVPGELIIFEDKRFLHNASPLVPVSSSPTFRDALVCTVNYPQTYPLRN